MSRRAKTTRIITASATALTCLACDASDEQQFEPSEAYELRAATPAGNDPLPDQVLDTISALLPEGEPAPAELLPPGFEPDLEAVEDTQVWITFVKEGAGYKNSFGYFTYPADQPPDQPLTPEELQGGLIFANASALLGGGKLYNGRRMHLGTVPAGHKIGFYLIANGYCTSGESCDLERNVDFSRATYYTIDALNPEGTPERRRHIVQALLDVPGSPRLLAWEDLNRDSGGVDDDFNDLIFRISTTPTPLGDPAEPSIDIPPLGDGRADQVCVRGDGSVFQSRSIDGVDYTSPGGTTYARDELAWCPAANHVLLFGDVDGDGLDDQVCWREDGAVFLASSIDGLEYGLIRPTVIGGQAELAWCPSNTHTLRLADVDHDGLDDQVCWRHDGAVFLARSIDGVNYEQAVDTVLGGQAQLAWCPSNNHTLLLADVDGDGLEDQVCWRHDGAVFQALSIDGEAYQQGGSTVIGGQDQLPWCPANGHTLRLADINGDGLDDQICWRHDGVVFQALSIDGVNYQQGGNTVVGGQAGLAWCPANGHTLLLEDVNGDGLDDQLCWRSDGAVFQALSIDGINYQQAGWTNIGGQPNVQWCPAAGHTLRLADVDGDGHDDQLCWRHDGVLFHSLSVDGVDFGAIDGAITRAPAAWCPPSNHALLLGDINGDGLEDQICWRDDGVVFQALSLDGVDFGLIGSTVLGAQEQLPWCPQNNHSLRLADVNGDELDDQICWRHDGAVFQALSIDGVNYDQPGDTVLGGQAQLPWCPSNNHTLLLADIDGDGLDDQVCWRHDGAVFQARSMDGVDYHLPGDTVIGGQAQLAWCPLANHTLMLGDVDGDGLDDQICWRHDGVVSQARSLDGVEYQQAGSTVLGGQAELAWCPANSHSLRLDDVNGDGREDLMCWRNDGAVFHALSIDGVNYELPGSTVLGGQAELAWCPADTHTLLLGDVDGH